MTISPTPQQLAELDHDQLERLAVDWRAQAARGDRRAFGMAHALEVERRRRLRESQLAQLEPLEPLEPLGPAPRTRAWWKFWR